MSIQQKVQDSYDRTSAGLTHTIQLEIRHKDAEALTSYNSLIDMVNQDLRTLNITHDTSKLSPVEKVSMGSLLGLKSKLLTRKSNVETRQLKKEPLVLQASTHVNASSYSSYMNGVKTPHNPSQPQPQAKEFKVPSKVPTSRTVSGNGNIRTVSNPASKPVRSSLDLPRPHKISTGSEVRSRSPPVRKPRPKSVDLSISQAALLAWDQNPRKVTPPSRALSPVRSKSKRNSMNPHATLQRRYDYVQPVVNTQINLTHVTRSKSPTIPHQPLQIPHQSSSSRSIPQKKKIVVSSNGAPVQQKQRETEKPPKEYDDPRITDAMNNLQGVDKNACEQILDEILVKEESLTWEDIAGLESAKQSLKETVVYPFLRPDLFRGLREPITGMLLFGPPGTGKTMIAKTVASEAKSTFFSISASSLMSKYLGESEKLIRALFFMSKKLSPSIIFFDEIDSLLTARSDGEHESSRRVKTEFLIQWSALSSATGRDESEKSRVLVLAATNLPWAIDEAARRRFTRRLYIPLPEFDTRFSQLQKLMQYQKHGLSETDFIIVANLTEGYSNSDITSLAKEAAMEPIRDLRDNLMDIDTKNIRGVILQDFEKAMKTIRKSVAKETLGRFEQWAANFGSTGA